MFNFIQLVKIWCQFIGIISKYLFNFERFIEIWRLVVFLELFTFWIFLLDFERLIEFWRFLIFCFYVCNEIMHLVTLINLTINNEVWENHCLCWWNYVCYFNKYIEQLNKINHKIQIIIYKTNLLNFEILVWHNSPNISFNDYKFKYCYCHFWNR